MDQTKQHTLADEISFSGKGLHFGEEAKVTIKPAKQATGLVLRVKGDEAPVCPDIADGSLHRTVLKVGDNEVHTVEHLLAALTGLGVDNAVIEVEGREIPGLDGSAGQIAEMVDKCGLTEQDAPRTIAKISRSVSASANDAVITAYPSKDGSFRITYILDYKESVLAQGLAEMTITPETMLREIAPCRTFVMKQHAEALRAAGFGQGANPQNTLVLDGGEVMENTLRFDDECIRHKILDVAGDLALVGRRLGVHVIACKSGHGLNIELAKILKSEIIKQENPKGLQDIKAIEATLPHRYPFLLVDRVLELEPRRRILALKNVTRNEEFFEGHFPGLPIMPGVLHVEALAQAAGMLMMREPDAKGKLAVLMGAEDVKWRRPVVPGDQIMLEVVTEKVRGKIMIVKGTARVDGDVVTEAKIKFALVEPGQYT
jgi:UDP-3-O-[3-hydroxymyristoyl] N-acetylglucosamine deacetylase/3-hydroxyacyl-[acyl-carrier-protein] dehydratase